MAQYRDPTTGRFSKNTGYLSASAFDDEDQTLLTRAKFQSTSSLPTTPRNGGSREQKSSRHSRNAEKNARMLILEGEMDVMKEFMARQIEQIARLTSNIESLSSSQCPADIKGKQRATRPPEAQHEDRLPEIPTNDHHGLQHQKSCAFRDDLCLSDGNSST